MPQGPVTQTTASTEPAVSRHHWAWPGGGLRRHFCEGWRNKQPRSRKEAQRDARGPFPPRHRRWGLGGGPRRGTGSQGPRGGVVCGPPTSPEHTHRRVHIRLRDAPGEEAPPALGAPECALSVGRRSGPRGGFTQLRRGRRCYRRGQHWQQRRRGQQGEGKLHGKPGRSS